MNQSTPQLVLAAAPIGGSRVRLFRDPGPNGAGRLLEQPPSFRYAGFDLRTLDAARLVDDGRLEVRNGDRKLVELHQNGMLLARLAADAQFLGWGADPSHFKNYPRLNALACVEAHAAFVHLFREVMNRFPARPTHIRMHQALRNAKIDGNYLFLTPFYPGPGIVVDPEVFQAHSVNADADHTFPVDHVLEQPNRIAGALAASFADFFDMPIEKMPFLILNNGAVEFDQAALSRQ